MNARKVIRPLRRVAGIALIPTLLLLSLLAVVVILFFSLAQSQINSSGDHAASYDLPNLREAAINTVLGQIREGSTEDGTLWISQPGAIRTYKHNGDPGTVYKLYSSNEMQVQTESLSSPGDMNLSNDVPADWKEQPGVFADLNEPVIRKDGSISFPIIDPRVYDESGTETPEGFRISTSHPTGGSVPGVVSSGTPSGKRLPMPVKWIYILKDGTQGTLDTSGTFTPFSGGNLATRENPMVGRFAFWADDESTKLNINTASEAIFWDTPRCATPEDVSYAKTLPTKNEVQRFGGHPATTCLSSVLLPGRRLDVTNNGDKELLRSIYRMVPRVSENGGIMGRGGAVVLDEDRLYPNVDEFLLDQEHSEQPFFESDPSRLRKLRFFLTANSRAPETTAAGTPRVSLWPVFHRDDPAHRTAYDRLVEFCTRVGNRPYHFRRNNAATNLGEYNTTYADQRTNADLLRYLLTFATSSKQGYSKSIADKYDPPGAHASNLTHNSATQIISFMETLRQVNLNDNSIAANGQQIIPYSARTEVSSGIGFGTVWIGSEVYGQVTTIMLPRVPAPFGNSLLRGTEFWTNGVGREYAMSEVGLALTVAAEHMSGGGKFNEALVDELNLPEGHKAIQVAQITEGFVPAQGYTMVSPSSSVQIDISDLQQLRLVTSDLTEISASSSDWGNMNSSVAHLLYLCGVSPNSPQPSRHSAADWWVGWGGSGGRWMYHSDFRPQVYSRGYFIIPSDEKKVTIKSPRGYLRFRFGNQRNGDWQGKQYYLPIPENFEVPVPDKPANFQRTPTWAQRYAQAKTNRFTRPEIIDPNDVVRTWVPRHGDHRIAYLRERESTAVMPNRQLFVPHPGWDPQGPNSASGSGETQIHSFVYSGGRPEDGATFERGLVRGVNYAEDIRPDFTLDPDTNGKFNANSPRGYRYSLEPTATRDWDTGTGIAPDGAYWGKVDDVAKVWDGSIPPYFSKRVWDGITPDEQDETIAPNQMIPGPVMFGSIPSAAFTGLQWTTLLFRPDITPGGHLGTAGNSLAGPMEGAPPDHTILDWFWMPVVQPYAVSEPFSTAGKLNMNYRIAPFTYIQRATGIHAVLKSERMLAIPTSAGATYKNYPSYQSNTGWRQPIDAETTLIQWEDKFNAGEFFMNPSEICEQFLVPENENISADSTDSLGIAMKRFWNEHLLTGDNVLERPYANIYPRLTTRSNTYRVHYLVQTLKKARSSAPDKFDAEKDLVTGETQGDALIERAIDPNDPDFSSNDYNFISNANFKSIDNLYTYRVRHIRRFNR